jgi:hypothetical protein
VEFIGLAELKSFYARRARGWPCASTDTGPYFLPEPASDGGGIEANRISDFEAMGAQNEIITAPRRAPLGWLIDFSATLGRSASQP